MKNILILEDNEKTLTALEQALCQISGNIRIYKAQTYEQACSMAFLHQIDVFVLDIVVSAKTPGDTSGIKLAEQIRKYEHYLFTPVIFISKLYDPELYAYRKIHCFGYLEKPFSMSEAVELVEASLKYNPPTNPKQVIYMRKDGILLAVKVCDVIYVSVNNHILDIHMQNDALQIPYTSIKKFINETGKANFIQCSRNTAINADYIKNIDLPNKYIQLLDNTRIEIGSSYYNKIRREILNDDTSLYNN